MSGPRILFTPAFGASIGGGHAMRGFTLAESLMARGAPCGVALSDEARQALAPYAPTGLEFIAAPSRLAAAQAFGATTVVIDDYDCDAADEAPLIEADLTLAVIDDLADRDHLCSLLVDPGFGRAPHDYHGLTPPGAQVLAGPDYALLRPQFAAARPRALARRRTEFAGKILVSLGLTDVGGVTAKVAGRLAGVAPLEVVLGPHAPSLAAVKALPDVTPHQDVSDMADLISGCDIGVGAGGVSVWERACLGLPSILLILAENQAPMAHALDIAGVAFAIDARADGFEGLLADAVHRLLADAPLRQSMARKSADLCDGMGAERVAEALLARLS